MIIWSCLVLAYHFFHLWVSLLGVIFSLQLLSCFDWCPEQQRYMAICNARIFVLCRVMPGILHLTLASFRNIFAWFNRLSYSIFNGMPFIKIGQEADDLRALQCPRIFVQNKVLSGILHLTLASFANLFAPFYSVYYALLIRVSFIQAGHQTQKL